MVRVQPTPGAASKVRDVMELIDRLGYYLNFGYRNPEVREDTKDGESHVLLQWKEANRETITSARVTHRRRIRGSALRSYILQQANMCTRAYLRRAKFGRDEFKHSLRSLSAQGWVEQGTRADFEVEPSDVPLSLVQRTIANLLTSPSSPRPTHSLASVEQGDGKDVICHDRTHILRLSESESAILEALDKCQPGSLTNEAIQRLASYETGGSRSSWMDFETLKSLADRIIGLDPSHFQSGPVWVSLKDLLRRQVKQRKITEEESGAISKTISSALSTISTIVPLLSTPSRAMQIGSDSVDSDPDASGVSRLTVAAATDDSSASHSLFDPIQGSYEVTTSAPSSRSISEHPR
ncbi:hypothetical protein QFC20_001485 [Naganishia adeliensis]|uniref:Uncharacterized protein n=1 Tax=Naganishia adeliensis TaxID=92952 RepID=A0ACC2WT60_9TREE|nr:hypothetical protein QFC20_001485 [Naganishia adeliensis]